MAERETSPLLNSFLLGAALVVTIGVVVWMASGVSSRNPEADALPVAEGTASAEERALFTLGPFTFDVAKLEGEWQEERAAVPLEPGADVDQLVQAFYTTNEQAAQGADETQLHALNDRFVVDVQRYLVAHGPRAYRAVGWQLVEAFHTALTEALARAEQRSVPAWEVLSDEDPGAQGWRQRLGNFFSIAQRAGLVDERGRPIGDPALLTVLFRYRWFGFAEDYASPTLMTPYERVVLWRWRIEAADGLPLPQRLALLEEIERVYDGPMAPDAVRGVLYYRAGDRERARGYLRRAAEEFPDDARYRQLLGVLDEAAHSRR